MPSPHEMKSLPHRSPRIVMLGKPGSGKGTQAALLAGRLGIPHLSSGAILREEIRERTPLGRLVAEYVQRGEIGPEELITTVILGFIERHRYGDGFVLDGFPRTVYQARELDARYPPTACILLSVPDHMIMIRISGRLTCRECGAIYHDRESRPLRSGTCNRCGGALETRSDDGVETIRSRLGVFRTEVEPVIRCYRRTERLFEIDGARPPEEIHACIMHIMSRPASA